MRYSQAIQASRTTRTIGELLDASPDLPWAIESDGHYVPVHGLYLSVEDLTPAAADAADRCTATVEIRVGRPGGGGRATRRITLTPAGCWLSCSGWNTCRVEVLELPAGAAVSYAWLREPPPSFWPLTLMQSVDAGTHPVPAGAFSVAVGTADAGWQWRARPSSAPAIVLAAPQLADGLRRPALGSAYTATASNVLSWELGPL